MKQKVQRQRQKREPLGEAKKPREVKNSNISHACVYIIYMYGMFVLIQVHKLYVASIIFTD